MLAKSKFVASRHSRIKASASTTFFSFDLATDRCPLKKVTSCSSFLTRSRISPNRRTSEEVRDVKLQDFRASAVAAPSTDSWTANMEIKESAFSAKIQNCHRKHIKAHSLESRGAGLLINMLVRNIKFFTSRQEEIKIYFYEIINYLSEPRAPAAVEVLEALVAPFDLLDSFCRRATMYSLIL